MKNSTESQLHDLLISRYRADPEGFRSFLPEAAQLLDAIYPPARSSNSPSGLTERERSHHRTALRDALAKLEKGPLSAEEVITALERCATLIQDDTLPTEVGYTTLVRLLKASIGKSPGSFRSVKTIPVRDRHEHEAINRVSLMRGVVLDLDRDTRLVSITVTPRKFRERHQMLALVGLGRDTAPDVALRHDDYLAEDAPCAAP